MYTFLDFLGDLGGVSGIFIYLFGLVCLPYAEYAYNLKMTKNLFQARTNDKNMFVKKDCDQTGCCALKTPPHVAIEIDKHAKINLHNSDRIKLFVNNYIPCLYNKNNWKRKSKMIKLYDLGFKNLVK